MKSKVYFTPLKDGASVSDQVSAMKKLYDASSVGDIISENDFVAIKLHIGEKGNTTHIKPPLIRVLVENCISKKAIPFLTETSTLYKGERHNAVNHILLAEKNGFGIKEVGAPFIMADGLLGNTEGEVIINEELGEKVMVAKEILSSDVIISVSHVTGHIVTGIGACIKNLGMGLASRKGKLKQHSAMKPEIKNECRFCGKCIEWCPEKAIIEKDHKAWIVKDKCVGCGECLSVCRFDAVSFDWGAEAGFTQRNMAEHALGVIKGRKHFFFNVMVDMTKDCDCYGVDQKKLIPDIGIIASSDPVAIDKASLDITGKFNKGNLASMSYGNQDPLIQINHGVKIGLGSIDYELITL